MFLPATYQPIRLLKKVSFVQVCENEEKRPPVETHGLYTLHISVTEFGRAGLPIRRQIMNFQLTNHFGFELLTEVANLTIQVIRHV